MTDKRVYSLDLVKSIAIYLVCFYHFGTMNYSLKTLQAGHPSFYIKYFFSGLSSISVPLFLMVNGALLLNRDYDLKKHLFKIVSIYLLFLVWGALTLVVEAPVYHDHYSIAEFVKAVFSAKEGRLDHLWFLQVLAYIYMMFPMLKAVYDKKETKFTAYLIGIIFLFTFGIVLLQDIINTFQVLLKTNLLSFNIVESVAWLNPFGMYFPHALVYFLLGGWITKKHRRININPILLSVAFVVSWGLLFLFGLWKTNTGKALYDMSFESNKLILPFIMTICVFILCLKINFKSEKLKKVISIIGSNTLGIYLIHVPLGVWLTSYYVKLNLSKYLVCDLLYVSILIALSLALTVLIRKIPLIKNLIEVKSTRSEVALKRLHPVIVAIRQKKDSISV